MPTIYLDVLLLQSLYVNYFLLRAAAKLTHTPLHWIRCGLAAAGSSLFSLLILLPPLPAWFQLVCKLLAAALSVTMAFGLHRESFFRQWGCFFLCNFLLAGAILGIGSLTQKGFGFFPVSADSIHCCGIFSAASLHLAPRQETPHRQPVSGLSAAGRTPLDAGRTC